MSESPAAELALQAVDRSRIVSGWPILVAAAVWAAGLPMLPRLVQGPVAGTSTAILVGFAVLALLTAGVALHRMPSDPVTAPFVGIAAASATLIALAPLDRPAQAGALVAFLLVAPWRYALPPLVVHFTLEVGWPHRRPRWVGWIIGWYAVELGMLVVVAAGMIMDEGPLVDAIDHVFRASVLEPAGAAVAVLGAMLALATPLRGRALRPALWWTMAAVLVGMTPLLLARVLPVLAVSLDGAATPARIALLALPVFSLVAVLSLPFRDTVGRDLLGYRLAAALLEDTDLSPALARIAGVLHESFHTRGVAVRIADPETVATIGEVPPFALRGPIAPELEYNEERQDIVAPIGRSGNPLGEVRLHGRFAGAFGRTERDWLTALLVPIGAVLRTRRRELHSTRRNDGLARQVADILGTLATAARELPSGPLDTGVEIPPPVDAREVLAQMNDGVTGISRYGQELSTSADDTRQRARGTSDSVARGLDALGALSAELAALARFGEEIAASNDTVSGVAFRTNLVANNASLEATRAGPAGRTFGVLAEEVRRLADTTAATSAAIGARTTAFAAAVGQTGVTLDAARQALGAAIREAEAAEGAAQRLNNAAAELDDAARSLQPAVAEANAVAKRRTARDQHLTATMERFLNERAALTRALTAHRDTLDRLSRTLAQPGAAD